MRSTKPVATMTARRSAAPNSRAIDIAEFRADCWPGRNQGMHVEGSNFNLSALKASFHGPPWGPPLVHQVVSAPKAFHLGSGPSPSSLSEPASITGRPTCDAAACRPWPPISSQSSFGHCLPCIPTTSTQRLPAVQPSQRWRPYAEHCAGPSCCSRKLQNGPETDQLQQVPANSRVGQQWLKL